MTSDCREKAGLLMEYAEATREYTRKVFDLSRAVSAMVHERYETLRVEAAAARERSEHARQRLQAHIRDHRC